MNARLLRTFKDGLLRTSDDDLLPDFKGHRISGDIRCLEHPALAASHTIFIREHNRIATELSKFGRNWNDEETKLLNWAIATYSAKRNI